MSILGEFIDGFISGWNESDNEMNGIAQVPQNPNSESVQVSPSSPQIINSFDEMSTWLNSLQRGASPAVKQAISAQINVIRFVQTPTLVDTTFDTLLYSLDKSLSSARSPEERAGIREVFCLMIQNYAFFMDAKYQMEVNKNREEGRKLFVEAGEMLSNSVKDIALMAVSGADTMSIANTTITNLFAPANGSGGITGLLNRLFNYINQEDILFEQQEQFYSSIEKIVVKLGEPDTQQLLGKSNLISGTIKRYVPEIRDFAVSHNVELFNANAAVESNFKTGTTILGIWLGVCFTIGVCRYLFSFSWKAPWLKGYLMWTAIIAGGLFLFFLLVDFVRRRAFTQKESELNDYFDTLYAINEAYKEPYESKDYTPTEAVDRFLQILNERGEEDAYHFAQLHLHDDGCEGLYIPVCEHFMTTDVNYARALSIADEGLEVAMKSGNSFVVNALTYDKAECLSDLGDLEQALTCYSYVESNVDPDLVNDEGENIKEVCTNRIKEISERLKNASTNTNEQDYLEMFKEYVADGDISERDRKILEKLRIRLGITEEKAKELEEACLNPQLSEDEKEYLEMCKEYAADGEISDRDRKMLNKMRDRMGISEERAKELETL